MLNLLLIGDIVGRPGRNCIRDLLPELKKNYQVDFTVANCENIAGGKGITEKTITQVFDYGVDVATSGNHVWDKKEVYQVIDNYDDIIRPANYPPGTPGKGYGVYQVNGQSIGIINLAGRIFMPNLDCPFRKAKEIIKTLKEKCRFIAVDFHAEATSEKSALARYLDGDISCLIGTHTHVQTADEKILPKGSGYITDAGMTGPEDSILGVKSDQIINTFLTQLPERFEIAESSGTILNGILIKISEDSGLCMDIERIQEKHEL